MKDTSINNEYDEYKIIKDDFDKEILDILIVLCEKYKVKSNNRVLCGRNRNVFILSSRIVVKIPINLDGFTDNDWEGSISNADDNPDEIRYAKTRMTYCKGVPIVFMEYVEYADSSDVINRLGYEPDWVMSVDCGQVGFNRFGKLVAFDYGMT